jgi:plastocyanin
MLGAVASLPAILGLGAAVFFAAGWTAHRQSAAMSGGEITGKIHFQGEKPKLLPLDMRKDPVCVSEHSGTVYAQDGEVNADGTLPNAFVYIKSGTGKLPETAPRNSVDLTQRGCLYEPHVLGIMVGQPLQVLTLDPTTHNIHVVGDANRDWNVTQQPGSPSVIRRFARPEVMIPVHCNEHPWMKAYIGVVSNPFYAVTGSDGSFALKGVPPGEYTLEVWTATFGTQEQKVVVRAGETASANFTFQSK